MKITIKITNADHIILLSKWASIGRTFDSAIAACHAAIEANPDENRFEIALEELQDLHQPLEELHRVVRQQLWNMACSKVVKRLLDREYHCRLEKGHPGPCRC